MNGVFMSREIKTNEKRHVKNSFRKRVLQSAVNFPVIVTQQYLTPLLKMEIGSLIPEPPVYFSTFF